MTTVENISWPELLKNPTATAQHGNGDNRIAAATETLKQTAKQFANVLNERARLLANSAQFDRALRDAPVIIAILPGSGLGYLCTGDVSCQQGHHAAAISIYDQGLQAVSESDPYYQQLQQQRLRATASNVKRIDFISLLPLDIVITNIIPRIKPKLYSHSLYGPLYVSRTWRDRFLQQPKGLDFHFGDKDTTFKTCHDQLVRFAPHVQSLDVSMKDIELDDLFSRAHFSNLRVLDIMCNPSTRLRRVMSGLRMFAASLTHLYIVNGYRLELRDILESCPSLVTLSMDEVNADVPLPPAARYPKLTHLAIHNVSDPPLDVDTLKDILNRLPSLLSFEITPMPDSSLLPILHEHCPYLQQLYFGDRSCRADKIDVHPNRKGITLARLHCFNNYYLQDDLIQFFLTHRKTLETIDCDGNIIRHDDALWDLSDGQILQIGNDRRGNIPPAGIDPTQSDTSLIRLASIRFAMFCSSSCNPIISWILLNAPNLKTISIKESLFRPELAKVMTKSKQLSKLEITPPWEGDYIFGEITRFWEDDFIFCEDDPEGIVEFLQYHIAMGDQSTLQEIVIRTGMSSTIAAKSISLIAKLACLKNLALLADFLPKECTSALAGCSTLEKLTLGDHGASFPDDFLIPLGTLPNLKCLRVGSESLSEVDLVALTTFPSLELLYLECDVPDCIMETLRKHIPRIILNPHLYWTPDPRLYSEALSMIHSIWNEVCQQPTLTATRPQYAKRASDSTTQLQQCIQNVLHVLNDRAIVLTLSADFATALRDATAMQEISPSSPLGYLRAASIYSEQGRQQAVVDICNEGLGVVDTKDPGYSKLQQAKSVAMQRASGRIDFISQLPLDIVTHVLLPMLLHDDDDDDDDGMSDPLKLCPYLDVSKIWCDRLLQAGGGAFRFSIYNEETSAQVTRYAQHTKAIRMRYYLPENWQSDFLRDANLCSLRKLEIKDLNQTIDVDHLVSSLKSISNTLTHLTISKSKHVPSLPGQDEGFTLFEPPEPPLHVAGILINCPNLETLDIVYRYDTDFKYVPSTMTWPKLTTLLLEHYDAITFNGQFLEILKRFPSLKKLAFDPCTEPQPMTMIQRYCPSLKDLKLTTKLRRSSRARARARYGQQQHEDQWINEGSGLEKLSISEEYLSYDTWMDMCPMLKQHHNTLVHLDLDLGYAGDNDRDLFNLEYPHLKTLNLESYSLEKKCFGWWIMRKAPFLEELSITVDIIISNPAILDYTPPPTLRKLVIDIFHINRLDDPTANERFLDRFSQQKEGISKELQLRFDNLGGLTPDSLVASICRFDQLQHLTISVKSRRTPWQVDHFVQIIVEGCPQLLSLELDAKISPSASAIKNLQKLQHLRHLGIKMDETAEYNDSWDALGTLSQLDSIRIFSNYRIDRSYIRNLKNQRPGVKVIARLSGF